jgi:phosphonate transport system permease protein
MSNLLLKEREEGQKKSVGSPSSIVASCKDLTLQYSDKQVALKKINLEFESGKHYAVMGPSGSGKTSLLGCLSGRLKATTGKVVCKGRVATIHQDLRLVAEKSALDNVLHGSFCRRGISQALFWFPKSERDRSIQLLCRVGLCEKIYVPVRRLSGGEQQRVAIARALMQDPSVLLADEPVAALDEDNAHEIMSLITALAVERKLTVVSVLHDYDLAKQYAERVVRLVNGHLVYDREAKTPEVGSAFTILKEDRRQTTASHLVLGPEHLPKKPFAWKSLPYLFLAVLIFAWSASGLNLHSQSLGMSFSGLFDFLKILFPSSIEEVLKIDWKTISYSLVETLQMAVIGTTLGVFISWPLAALAAKNVGLGAVSKVVRFSLNTLRTVPSLVWALLFVSAVGLGTLAGILALTMYSIGYLTKFFYESFEGVDPGPPEALKELGAGGLQRFVHAVWPAATPAVLSSSLFMLEYNVRAASVLGVVDAGGIGFYMKQYIDFRAFPSMIACLAMILLVVIVFDAISSRIREKLISVK